MDHFMPRWDVATRHETIIRGTPADVMRAVKRLDLGRSRLARALFRLRGMPRASCTLNGALRLGFVLLGERPDRELVLGLAGRFWTPRGDLRRVTPERFLSFAEPGTARAVWGFRAEPVGHGAVELITETRVACADASTRRRFRLYWFFVAPFSGLIRRECLRIIRRDVERR
jgi:hypothetical protein